MAAAGPVLGDGMGGINLTNLKITAEAMKIRWDKSLIRKILAVVEIWREKEIDGHD